MFITVTRFGGPASLRVAASAVAYIGEMPGGAVLHLLSGEYMRVDETAADIEQAVCAVLSPVLVAGEVLSAEPSPSLSLSLIEQQLATIVDHLGAHRSEQRRSPSDADISELATQRAEELALLKPIDKAKAPTGPVDPVAIDDVKEEAALAILDRDGLISGADLIERRVEIARRKRGGRRA